MHDYLKKRNANTRNTESSSDALKPCSLRPERATCTRLEQTHKLEPIGQPSKSTSLLEVTEYISLPRHAENVFASAF